MTTDNLTELIELLTEYKNLELDPRLEDGQIFASDRTVVTL